MPRGAQPRRPSLASLRTMARQVYGSDPAGYAAGRPDYPEDVYRILTERCGLGPGKSVAECGPGSGLVTRRLLAQGASVLAVEPDPGMARHLTEVLPTSQLQVVVSTFEEADLGDACFDLVVAATSFHWVEPAAGFATLGRIVRPGGWVALWWSVFDDPFRPDPFREATLGLLGGSDPDGQRERAAFQLNTAERTHDLERISQLHGVTAQTLHWSHRFDVAGLRAFYGSLIELRRRPPHQRRALLNGLEDIARDRFGGSVERPFVTVIYTGQRPEAA